MNDPVAAADDHAAAKPPRTAGSIAFLVFRGLWTLVSAQAVAGLLEAEFRLPYVAGFVVAAPACWWLSGLFRAWGRRRPPAQGAFNVKMRGIGDAFFRGVWSLIAAMTVAHAVQLHFAVASAPAWIAGAAVGVGWFAYCRRFDDRSAFVRFFAPASLPMGVAFAELVAAGLFYVPFAS